MNTKLLDEAKQVRSAIMALRKQYAVDARGRGITKPAVTECDAALRRMEDASFELITFLSEELE